MVKPALLVVAVVGLAAALGAAFLPFQLDRPKHDNPVDPLSPQGLARLAAALTPASPYSPTITPTFTISPTATPTPTPVLPQVIAELPATGATVPIPFTTLPINAADSGVWDLTLDFNTDMDASTYSLPGALSFSPPADFVIVSQSPRSLTLRLDTINDNGSAPLQLSTAYTVTASAVMRSAGGLALQPAVLHYSTGPFKLAVLLSGNSAGAADGVFYPGALSYTGWQNYLCAVFNAPLDTSVPLASQVQVSPNVITGIQWGPTAGSGPNVCSVAYSFCNAVPSTLYTFSYGGGLADRVGAIAPAVGGIARTSEPLRLSVWYSPPSFPYLVVQCNYQVDISSANSALSVTPPPNVPGQWQNNGCAPGSGTPPSYMYIDGRSAGVASFASGSNYTVSVSTALMDITLSQPLPAPWSYTFYQP